MAATSSLASSYLADLHRAGGASPSPLPRRIRSSSASGALAAARSASSPWPDPQAIQASDAVLEAALELGFLDTATATSHGLPSAVVLPGRKGKYYLCYASSSRILPRPWSTSELIAGDRVLRRDLDTGDHVHRPRLSRWLRPPRRSSSPVPPPSPRRILRRPRPTPELVAGAVSVTTQDPLPSMRPAPCRSSPVAASSTLELVADSRVRAADVNLIYAAPIVTFVLVSERGGQGAIPLGQYPNGIPVV
uniref:Uncharacterized protein n=1 Tax=Oryza nivara TaxID=4536 RepID=A0A0E0GHD7_ORYNI